MLVSSESENSSSNFHWFVISCIKEENIHCLEMKIIITAL
jgi:hypothetical protein